MGSLGVPLLDRRASCSSPFLGTRFGTSPSPAATLPPLRRDCRLFPRLVVEQMHWVDKACSDPLLIPAPCRPPAGTAPERMDLRRCGHISSTSAVGLIFAESPSVDGISSRGRVVFLSTPSTRSAASCDDLRRAYPSSIAADTNVIFGTVACSKAVLTTTLSRIRCPSWAITTRYDQS